MAARPSWRVQFGILWTPIGAEQTASGYEVAWKIAGTDQYLDLEHRQQRQLHLQSPVPSREPARRWNRWRPASTRT